MLMKSVSRCVNSGGRRESAEADGDAQAADGDDGRARALQYRKNEAGPIDESRVHERQLRTRNFSARCRKFSELLHLFGHVQTRQTLARFRAAEGGLLWGAGSAAFNPDFHLRHGFGTRERRRSAPVAGIPGPAD